MIYKEKQLNKFNNYILLLLRQIINKDDKEYLLFLK